MMIKINVQKNKKLHKAKKNKNDEFYTRYEDIDAELRLYDISVFKDKIVYLPFDNCFHSNFFLWFLHNFNRLGIKKLVSTNYDISFKMCGFFDEGIKDEAYYCEITNVPDGANTINDVIGLEGNLLRKLKNNSYEMAGDFRSPFCGQVLNGADIIVSNPPFSLFREILRKIKDKKFILLAFNTSCGYNHVFRLIKEKKLFTSNGIWFSFLNVKKKILCLWLNNIKQVHERKQIELTKSVKELLKYDNYNAYNCNLFNDIPFDYDGVIGVPITFLYSEKIDLNLFEIIDLKYDCKINNKLLFIRVFVRLKR